MKQKQKPRRENLTQTSVEKLTKRAVVYDVNDTLCPGFLVRVQVSGAKTYYVRYKTADKKKQRYFRLCDAASIPVKEARDAARLYLADAVKGNDPQEVKHRPKDHTLKTFLAIYKQGAPRAKAAKANVTRIEHSFADLLNTPISDIRPMWVQGWQRKRHDAGAKESTINREVTALRSVLSFAVDSGFMEAHPLRRVKQLTVDSATRPRYLKPEELLEFHKALDAREETMRVDRDSFNKWREDRHLSKFPDLRALAFADYLRPMVLLALNTGLRRGELFNLTWADCELQGAAPTLTVQGAGAKSGKTRHIPLNRTALDVLTKWKAQGEGEGLVFVSPKTGGRFDNISSSWDALAKTAKLPDFRFHDCRHHFASMLVQGGVDLNTVRELLGHSDLKLTLRYAYLAPENAARAVAVLDAPVNVIRLEKKAEGE